MVIKLVKIMEHGTVYFNEHGRLMGCPISADGSADKGTYHEISESPLGFKAAHIAVLIKLGLPRRALKRIHYY